MEAIKAAGLKPGEQVALALDCAASEFFDKSTGKYALEGEGKTFDGKGLVDFYAGARREVPDRLHRGRLRRGRLGDLEAPHRASSAAKIQLVGDDLFVTNVDAARRAASQEGIANSILVKVNQIGSLTETLEAVRMAHRAGYTSVMSHRSGETEDTTIADLAVACDCGQIKTGSASRTDRDREVQPAAPHRGGARQGRPLRRPRRVQGAPLAARQRSAEARAGPAR